MIIWRSIAWLPPRDRNEYIFLSQIIPTAVIRALGRGRMSDITGTRIEITDQGRKAVREHWKKLDQLGEKAREWKKE